MRRASNRCTRTRCIAAWPTRSRSFSIATGWHRERAVASGTRWWLRRTARAARGAPWRMLRRQRERRRPRGDTTESVLARSVVITPNVHVNRGVLWAKANMLRTQLLAPTGWGFVNDPTRSNNSVGRDTASFSLGSDYVTPDFSRESLRWYLDHAEPSGKIVEYFDVRNGKSEDYGLNVNDDTPLVVLALAHHYRATGNLEFLREMYPESAQGCRLPSLAARQARPSLVHGDGHLGTGHHRLAEYHRRLPHLRCVHRGELGVLWGAGGDGGDGRVPRQRERGAAFCRRGNGAAQRDEPPPSRSQDRAVLPQH